MMNEINIKKMEELLANEEFAQKIEAAGSYENAYKLFAENGVDASREEFMAYLEDCHKDMVENGLLTEDGELGPDLLDMVSGGNLAHKVVGTGLIFCGSVFVASRDQRFVKVGNRLIAVGKFLWRM